MIPHRPAVRLQVGLPLAAFPLLAGILGIALCLQPREPPHMNRGYSPHLPTVRTASPVRESPHDSYVMVSDDGYVFFHSKWVPANELPGMCRAVAQQSLSHPGSRVLLKMGRSTPFRRVRHLLRSLQAVGIREVTFLVESRNPA